MSCCVVGIRRGLDTGWRDWVGGDREEGIGYEGGQEQGGGDQGQAVEANSLRPLLVLDK